MFSDPVSVAALIVANVLFWIYGVCCYRKKIFFLPRELTYAGFLVLALTLIVSPIVQTQYYVAFIVCGAVGSLIIFGAVFLLNMRNGNYRFIVQSVGFDEEKGLFDVLDAFNEAVKDKGGAVTTYNGRTKLIVAKRLSPESARLLFNMVKEYTLTLRAKTRFLLWPVVTSGVCLALYLFKK